MLSVHVTLGIFLLLAARDPSANRSLIAFTVWSSFAHAAIMAVLAFQNPSERGLVGRHTCAYYRGRCANRVRAGKAIDGTSRVVVLGNDHN